jgi:hypothetical protein
VNAADLQQLPTHHQQGPVEVDVLPAQRQRFTTAQPGRGDRLVEGAEVVGGEVVEQHAQLVRFQWSHLRPLPGRQPRQPGHVGRDETFALRVGQRRPQCGPHALLGRRAHRPGAGLLALGVDGGEHRLDVGAAQPPDLDPPEIRHEVVVDVLPVRVQRPGPDVDLRGQPLAEVLGDGEPAAHINTAAGLGLRLVERLLRLSSGRVPATAQNATLPLGARRQLQPEEPRAVVGRVGPVSAAQTRACRAQLLAALVAAAAPLVRRACHLEDLRLRGAAGGRNGLPVCGSASINRSSGPRPSGRSPTSSR